MKSIVGINDNDDVMDNNREDNWFPCYYCYSDRVFRKCNYGYDRIAD